MLLGRIVGNVIATIKDAHYKGSKLLLVEPYDIVKHSFTDETVLAIDTVDAGEGDIVLVINEGGSVRAILNNQHTSAEMVIAAVVDHVNIEINGKTEKMLPKNFITKAKNEL